MKIMDWRHSPIKRLRPNHRVVMFLLDTLPHIIRTPVFSILTADCSSGSCNIEILSKEESLGKSKYNMEEENRTRTLEEIEASGA